jgi:hypothetical protein
MEYSWSIAKEKKHKGVDNFYGSCEEIFPEYQGFSTSVQEYAKNIQELYFPGNNLDFR